VNEGLGCTDAGRRSVAFSHPHTHTHKSETFRVEKRMYSNTVCLP